MVVYGHLFGVVCEGVVLAAALSTQDPFTLPSHLVTKDPAEYAESLLRSYGGRQHSEASQPGVHVSTSLEAGECIAGYLVLESTYIGTACVIDGCWRPKSV